MTTIARIALGGLLVITMTGCAEQQSNMPAHNNRPIMPKVPDFEKKPSLAEPGKSVAEEPAGVLNMRQALTLALTQSPQLEAFSWEMRASEARRLQAGLAPNPELQMKAGEIGGSGPQRRFEGAEMSIGLSQLIEMGDKRRKRAAVADVRTDLIRWDYEAARLDVLSRVSAAFIEVLAAQKKLKLADELLGISNRMAEAVSRLVDAGKDSAVAASKARIAHNQIQIAHKQAKQNLHLAKVRLVAFWGGTQPVFSTATGDIDVPVDIPEVGKLLAVVDGNPDLARWVAEIDLRQRMVAYERARGVQDITAGVGLQYFEESDNNTVMFGLSIPIGVSDRNQGGRQAALHELSGAAQRQKAAQIRVRQLLAQAYQSLANAHVEAVTLRGEMLPSARSVFEASQEAYAEGKLDYLHLLDAQRTFFEVQSQYIDALAAFQQARLDVERLIGQQLETV